ncbi:MAG: tetratricopeptide repeat protein, partial [Pseudomonadota bacterium]
MGTSVNQALRKAQTHARKGEVEDARRLYSEILRSYPKNARARMALAALGADQARDETTVLLALYTAGKFTQAAARAVELLDQTPKSPVLWNILGAALGQLNDHDGALRAFEQSCIVAPTHPDGFSNLGNTLKRLERFEEAVTSYARATALGENTAALHCSQGVAYTALAQHARALGAFKKAVALEQTSARAQFGIGIASAALGDLDGALEAYETAAKLSPADLAVHTNIGNLRHQMGQQHAALAAYQKALLIAPANALVQYNVGKAYFALGQWQNAIDAFVIARAQDPLNERIHNSLGTAYQQIGRRTDAMDSYQQALSHDPDMANAHANIGVLHQEEGRRAEAINAFSRALALQPDFPLAEAQMLHQRQHLCDWSQTDHLKDACTRLGITTAAVPSFTMLASEDNPAHQLARSRRWAAEMFRITPKPLPASPAARPERLRIGYFSADFRNHPVLHLISGLLRSHDRKTFDVLAFGYGKQSDGALANQMKMDVDQFFD